MTATATRSGERRVNIQYPTPKSNIQVKVIRLSPPAVASGLSLDIGDWIWILDIDAP
jgi:hypothetical protein